MGRKDGKHWYRKGRELSALPQGTEERLAAKLVANGECLEFCGFKTPKGYGQLKVGGQAEYAHRIAYALWVGELEAGMTVDHTCRNCSCCNPAHLRLLTVEDNLRARYANEAQDHAHAADTAVDAMLAQTSGPAGVARGWKPWYGENEPWL
jgi:hypothetical protein